MFIDLERQFDLGDSSALLLPDPHKQVIVSAGKLLEKISKDNYYEWEIDLYFLTKAVFQYFYQKHSKTQEDLSRYYHYIQIAQTKLDFGSLDFDKDSCLNALKKVVLLDQYAFVYLATIIGHFYPVHLFADLVPYIEAFIVFRSHFSPDEYRRIWNGILDTVFIHKAFDQKLTESKDIIRFYQDCYGTCWLKRFIRRITCKLK